MDFSVLLTGGVGIITTIVGSWTSWIFARKKYNAEVDSTLIENLTKIINAQNDTIANFKTRLDESMARNAQLETELMTTRAELVEVRKQVSELMMKLIDLHVVLPDANVSKLGE